MDLENDLNEVEIYDEVDVAVKVLSFGEEKASNTGNKYIKFTKVDSTNCESSLNFWRSIDKQPQRKFSMQIN